MQQQRTRMQWIMRVSAQAYMLIGRPTHVRNPICGESPLVIGSVSNCERETQLELDEASEIQQEISSVDISHNKWY